MTVQAMWRGVCARRLVANMRTQQLHNSAIAIQVCAHGHVCADMESMYVLVTAGIHIGVVQGVESMYVLLVCM